MCYKAKLNATKPHTTAATSHLVNVMSAYTSCIRGMLLTFFSIESKSWSPWYNKTVLFSSSSGVPTTIWMHQMNANKTDREKTRRKLRKNSARCLQQILEATSNKITAVQPLVSHLINHLDKTSKTYGALLEKKERTHMQSSCMHSYIWTHQW